MNDSFLAKKALWACLFVAIAIGLLLISIGLAQDWPSQPKTAYLYSDGTHTDATWTLGPGDGGTYKFQPIVVMPIYLYRVTFYDITAGGWEFYHYDFTTTYPPCDQTTPTVNLTSSHSYRMALDFALGNPPGGRQVAAKCTIFYLCADQ